MKNIKYLFLLLFINSFLFADISNDSKDRLDGILNKTNAIAKAHISLIEDRALLSTSLDTLITNGYIDPNITSSNLYGGNLGYASINVTSKLLDLNTNIAVSSLTADERGYFLNNYKDSIFAREVYEKSGEFWVKYYYSGKAINVLMNDNTQNTYIGEAEPTSYTTVSANQTWWDSNDVSFNVKKYVGTNWVNEDYNNQKLNSNGTFLNINNIPLTKTYWSFSQVTSTEQTKPVECARVGATYDQATNRCIGYTSDACDGNYFDTTTGMCYKKPIDYCNAIGYTGYDGASNRCTRGSIIYANKNENYFPYLGNEIPTTIVYRNNNSGNLIYGQTWGGQNASFMNSIDSDSGFYNTTIYAQGGYNIGSYGGCAGAGAFQILITYYNDNYINVNFLMTSDYAPRKFNYIVNRYSILEVTYTQGRDTPRFRIDFNTGYVYNGYCKDAWRAEIYGEKLWNLVGYLEGFQNRLTCSAGYVDNGANCKKETIEYLVVPSSYGTGYALVNNGISGVDAYIKNPSCSGKVSSMGGVATPTYGNNGICYSNTALYCRTYASSTNPYVTLSDGRVINCWDTQRSCNDSTYNIVLDYSGANDKCSKFNYSCFVGNLYGLATHPTNNNTLDLFNRISNKDTKATSNATTLVSGNRIINDNNGAMCVTLSNSTFLPSTVSGNYTINGIQKSGF